MAEPETEVVVRRRRSLMAAVAALSAAFAAGYVWRFVASASATSLAVGVVLALVSLCFWYAWLDARAPLLVADATGLRVRLGSAWTGVPWELVETVEVEERGSVRDGQVSVLVASPADLLAGAGWRSRWAAWLNRWLYDAPLVVPFGLTTTVSTPDVAGALDVLSAGRSPVVVVNGPHPEPEATVELAPSRAVAAEQTVCDVDPAGIAVPAITFGLRAGETGLPAGSSGLAVAEVPAAAATVHAQRDAPAQEEVTVAALVDEVPQDEVPRAEVPQDEVPQDEVPRAEVPQVELPQADVPPPGPKARRKHWISRTSGRFGASRTAVSDYTATPARREDVTIAARATQPTVGSLALSSHAVAPVSETLPEISHLRRPSDPDHGDRAGDGGPDQATSSAASLGNVSLIIDATTDITARAMQRVRAPEPPHPGRTAPERAAVDVPLAGTVIGSQLTEARVTLGLSIDELAERTRIRPYVIESIEVDDFSPCGGDFYARGHLRMLSRVLGIESAPLIQAYDARFASTPVNARKVFEVELATGSTGMVRGSSSGANWWALMAAVLALLLVWGVARFVTADPDPTSSVGTGTGTGTGAQHVPGEGSGRSSNPLVHVTPPKAQVKLTASGADSRVTVLDGRHQVLFRGVLVDGTSKKFEGRAPLRVRAADAGAVRLSVKGRPLGPVGSSGVAAHRLVAAPGSATSSSSQRRPAG